MTRLPHCIRARRSPSPLTRPHRSSATRGGGTSHAHATSHPIIRSLEPGEDWDWCYFDEVAFVVDGIRGKTHIPQSADRIARRVIIRRGGARV